MIIRAACNQQPFVGWPTRRQFIRSGVLATASLFLSSFLRLRFDAASSHPASAESCILIFLNGGMSHIDTFDPKPEAPAEIRGEFATIGTSTPGVRITEHLTRLARHAHRYAVLRTISFVGSLGNHSPACYHMLTGQEPTGEAAVLAPPQPTDQPTMGSVAARFRPTPLVIPAFVMVPDVLIENVFLTPGQFAGWLGTQYESFRVQSDPSAANFAVPALVLPEDVSPERITARRDLLHRVSRRSDELAATRAGRELDPYYQRAFDLLTTSRAQDAFNIAAEPPSSRERYGLDKFGQSVLLARRLVEAGVRFVNVHWPNVGGGRNWDTHGNGFARLKNELIPPLDLAVSALLDDLSDRGLLGQTLVVVMTEFGRAPYIGKTFQNNGSPGGRDHWSDCFSVLLAGGGVRGGMVFGRSDRVGAYPADKPLAPSDLVATILHALGIDPHGTLYDSQGLPRRLSTGSPVLDLFD